DLVCSQTLISSVVEVVVVGGSFLNRWREDNRGVRLVHESLGELGVAQVPVTDQLVGERSGHPGDVEGEHSVLQDRSMILSEDVSQVVLIGPGSCVRLMEGLVTSTTSSLHQSLSTRG